MGPSVNNNNIDGDINSQQISVIINNIYRSNTSLDMSFTIKHEKARYNRKSEKSMDEIQEMTCEIKVKGTPPDRS